MVKNITKYTAEQIHESANGNGLVITTEMLKQVIAERNKAYEKLGNALQIASKYRTLLQCRWCSKLPNEHQKK